METVTTTVKLKCSDYEVLSKTSKQRAISVEELLSDLATDFAQKTKAHTTAEQKRQALNVILGLFNLIPLPPLDGATAITLVLPEDTALRFREVLRTGSFGLVGLLVAWWLFIQAIGPLFAAILRLVHPDVPYR